MDKVSYLVVNAFIGLVNTMAIDKPDAIHDPALGQRNQSVIFQIFGHGHSPLSPARQQKATSSNPSGATAPGLPSPEKPCCLPSPGCDLSAQAKSKQYYTYL